MSLFGSEHWMYSSGGAFYDTQIDGSLRFNDDDNAYLNRTPASAGNRKTMTFSFWFKIGNLNTNKVFYGYWANATNYNSFIYIDNVTYGGKIRIYDNTGSTVFDLITSQYFRDPSAWYHLVLAIDTTQATASNRIKLYINGEQVTAFDTASYPSQNADCTVFNNSVLQYIGYAPPFGGGTYMDGYLAEFNFIDGQQLDPTSFGETKSGVWIPKAYSGSYGTNGFHLEFAGNANDSSGNGNNWTANNISSYDYVPDSPTLNFCTINPLSAITPVNLQQGNLQYSTNGGQASYYAGSMAMSSGKWYFEYRLRSGNVDIQGGIVALPATPINSSSFDSWRYKTNGNLEYAGGYQSSWATSYTTGDVIGIAVDVDGGTFKAYKNGTLVGTKTGISTSATWIPYFLGYNAPTVNVNFGQDSTFAGATTAGGNSDANGFGDFKYAPPSGYLALCTANLTVAEAVDPAEDNSPQDYFAATIWTGNGSTSRAISTGHDTDFVWLKQRNVARQNHVYDDVRGATKLLYTSLTNAEQTLSNGVIGFGTDGFTVGNEAGVNESGGTYVAWTWKANGSGSSNTDGSITSTVSANTESGFSIVSYTGTGSVGTVGHGLNSAPEFFMCKNRDYSGENWTGYSAPTGNTQKLELNTSNGAQTTSNWNNTSPTSSVFTLGANDNSNRNGNAHIAYCFHSVDGFSKIGSYTGNGSSDGAFVYTGFRPAFVMLKKSSGTADWNIRDTARSPSNVVGQALYPNLSFVEYSGTETYIDIVSNGFKLRGNWNSSNASGGTYIYMAFAENPFKYANAR